MNISTRNDLTPIERDAEIRKQTRAYVAAVLAAHPELTKQADELDKRVRPDVDLRTGQILDDRGWPTGKWPA